MWIHHSDYKSVDAAIKEIETGTDRATGIVASAFVEDHLTTVLRKRFHQDEDLLNRLFKGEGPLASFSVKINMAFLIGLFSNRATSDLHRIRKIRNAFAHNVANDSFTKPPIKDIAMDLSIPDWYALELKADTIDDDPAAAFTIKIPSDEDKTTISNASRPLNP